MGRGHDRVLPQDLVRVSAVVIDHGCIGIGINVVSVGFVGVAGYGGVSAIVGDLCRLGLLLILLLKYCKQCHRMFDERR